MLLLCLIFLSLYITLLNGNNLDTLPSASLLRLYYDFARGTNNLITNSIFTENANNAAGNIINNEYFNIDSSDKLIGSNTATSFDEYTVLIDVAFTDTSDNKYFWGADKTNTINTGGWDGKQYHYLVTNNQLGLENGEWGPFPYNNSKTININKRYILIFTSSNTKSQLYIDGNYEGEESVTHYTSFSPFYIKIGGVGHANRASASIKLYQYAFYQGILTQSQINDIFSTSTTTSPTTTAPTTAPTTTAPTTTAPTTKAPTTYTPTTSNPTTAQPTYTPTTSNPTTAEPTYTPTTSNPTTAEPTYTPTTSNPTTAEPTYTPTTSNPITAEPTTYIPTTSSPITATSTYIPSTANPTTATPTYIPTTTNPITATPSTSNPTSDPIAYPATVNPITSTSIPISTPSAYPTSVPTMFSSEYPTLFPSEYPTLFPSKAPITLTSPIIKDAPANKTKNDMTVVIIIAISVLILIFIVCCLITASKSKIKDHPSRFEFEGSQNNELPDIFSVKNLSQSVSNTNKKRFAVSLQQGLNEEFNQIKHIDRSNRKDTCSFSSNINNIEMSNFNTPGSLVDNNIIDVDVDEFEKFDEKDDDQIVEMDLDKIVCNTSSPLAKMHTNNEPEGHNDFMTHRKETYQ